MTDAGELTPITATSSTMDEAELDAMAALAMDIMMTTSRLSRTVSRSLDIPLSLAQSRALWTLREEGPQRVSVLARQQRCSQPSMTTLIDRMETAGFVSRTADPADARAVIVAITEAGRRMLDQAADAIATTMVGPLDRLAPDDRSVLVAGLSVLRRLTESLRGELGDASAQRAPAPPSQPA